MSESTDKSTESSKKSPLQLIKERQAAQAKNIAAKQNRSAPSGEKSEGGATSASAKPMRSSSTKSG